MADASGAHPSLRVLYLSWRDRDNPEAGGAEVFTERTAEVLAGAGHTVTLFTSAFPGARREDRHGRVRVLRAGNRFTCYLRGLVHLWRHRSDYDVVIDVQNGVPFWSPLVASVPVVTVVHHVHEEQWRAVFGPVLGRVGWFLESRVAPRVHRSTPYVTVSEATRTELAHLGVDPARTYVVYSGNDLPDHLEQYARVERSHAPSLVVLGRLVPHKHVETAVDVVDSLTTRHPDVELHVVGDGYWHDEIVRHATTVGVSDRVHMHGFVDEDTKHRLLASAWVVVMPSHKEGWGLTLVEAAVHGTPAVAFGHAGGPSESVIHGMTGLLAADVEEMTAHVDRLLSDEELRTTYGRAARRHARLFDWSRTGDRLAEVLTAAVTGRLDEVPVSDSVPALAAADHDVTPRDGDAPLPTTSAPARARAAR